MAASSIASSDDAERRGFWRRVRHHLGDALQACSCRPRHDDLQQIDLQSSLALDSCGEDQLAPSLQLAYGQYMPDDQSQTDAASLIPASRPPLSPIRPFPPDEVSRAGLWQIRQRELEELTRERNTLMASRAPLSAVKAIHQYIVAHRRAQNTLIPISKLPTELLTLVFLHYHSMYAHGPPDHAFRWPVVLHVSHTWRALARDLPALWDTLDYAHPTLAEEFVRLSRNRVNLRLRFHARWAPGEHSLHFISSLAHPIVALDFRHAPSFMTRASSPLAHFAEHMRTVHFCNTMNHWSLDVLPTVVYTNLQSLHLCNCVLDWSVEAFRACSQLREFYLCFPRSGYYNIAERDFVQQLFVILGSLQALEDVVLRWCIAVSEVVMPPVELPNLRRLRVEDGAQNCLLMLTQLVVPPTCSTELFCETESQLVDDCFALFVLALPPNISQIKLRLRQDRVSVSTDVNDAGNYAHVDFCCQNPVYLFDELVALLSESQFTLHLKIIPPYNNWHILRANQHITNLHIAVLDLQEFAVLAVLLDGEIPDRLPNLSVLTIQDLDISCIYHNQECRCLWDRFLDTLSARAHLGVMKTVVMLNWIGVTEGMGLERVAPVVFEEGVESLVESVAQRPDFWFDHHPPEYHGPILNW